MKGRIRVILGAMIFLFGLIAGIASWLMGATARAAIRLFGWWLACLAGLLLLDWDGLHAGAAAQPWLARSVQALFWAVLVGVTAVPLLGLALALAALGAWFGRLLRYAWSPAKSAAYIRQALDWPKGGALSREALAGTNIALAEGLAQVTLDAGGALKQAGTALDGAADALENASSAEAETAAREARAAAVEARTVAGALRELIE